MFKNILFSSVLAFLATPTFAQSLYDLNKLTTLEFTFPEQSWQYTLHYYYSRKKDEKHYADLVVNGEKFDSVSVKFKGQSSYSRKYEKNPLRVELDEWTDKKYDGFEVLKLSNGNLDPSWLREVLAYQIARKYMVAPQSNFAKVYVNGEYHGLFGNTESVNGDFAKRYLNAKDSNPRFKGNAPEGRFTGGPSSLEYLGDDPDLYHKYYELKSDRPADWNELVKLIKTIKKEPEKIEEILDMNSAIWMLAFNNVLLNLDSYSDFRQNYYLIQDNNGRFHFILWDLNLCFDGLGKDAGVTMQPNYDPLKFQNDKRYPLLNLVLNNPTYRKMYFAHCRTILEENMSNGWYKTEAAKHRNLIDEAVKADNNWLFTYEDFQRNLHNTVTRQGPAPFPYPGLTEVMEARASFLRNHREYTKKAPVLGVEEISSKVVDSLIHLGFMLPVSDARKVILMYRQKGKKPFQKMEMQREGDSFVAEVKGIEKKLEYYFYAENEEAGEFYPKRAAKEFLVWKAKK